MKDCCSRASTINKMKLLPAIAPNTFNVEPSLAQKDIDVKNWVGALNAYSAETKRVTETKDMGDKHPEVKDEVPLKSTKVVKKFKTKFTKEQPQSDNYGPKSNLVKSLLSLNGPVGGQTRFVYMYRIDQNVAGNQVEEASSQNVVRRPATQYNRRRMEVQRRNSQERNSVGSRYELNISASRYTNSERISEEEMNRLKADAIRRTMIEYGKRVMKRGPSAKKKGQPVASVSTDTVRIVDVPPEPPEPLVKVSKWSDIHLKLFQPHVLALIAVAVLTLVVLLFTFSSIKS